MSTLAQSSPIAANAEKAVQIAAMTIASQKNSRYIGSPRPIAIP